MIQEQWKDIRGHEGLYQVSSLGRIKSCSKVLYYSNGKTIHRKEMIRVLSNSGSGYLTVTLSKNNKSRTYNVHSLVATAFLENPENLPYINHKDEDKTNNIIDNLEWCSESYNTTYNNAMKRRVEARNKNNSYGAEKKVFQYDLHGNLIKIWDSLISIERDFGYKHTNISSCCSNKKYRNTAYGYKWSYKPLS